MKSLRWFLVLCCCGALWEGRVQAQEVSKAEAVRRFGGASEPVPTGSPFGAGGFQIEEGETLVFVGQANLVREQKSGELEARLAVAFASRKPRFRSMAWEADTVYEQWRDLNFGDWKAQLAAAEATTIIAQFGQMEVLDGVGRLQEFVDAYERLLDQFAVQTRRVVILSPIPFDAPESEHVPNLTARNADVQRYTEAIGQLARRRGAIFVDLFTPLAERSWGNRITENGVHLSPKGLSSVADLTLRALGVGRVRRGRTLEAVMPAIVQKNRLWFDSWRPMNWAFAYGDRTHVEFGQPPGTGLWLKEELERFKPLLAAADARIHALASGDRSSETPPMAPAPPPATAPATATNRPASDFTVESEQASFTASEGCEVNLFASEANGLVKPIQMVWDEKGRLWVACAPTYPQVVPGIPPADFILVCEDRDGDGRVDRSWRFAEGLFLPQGLELAEGGLYVCNGTELLWLGDRDGDGRADERRVVLSGFGTGDSHQLINSIGHGPDGSIWFTQGLHVVSRVETPWGISRLDRSGVWQFRPRTLRLDGYFNGAKAGHNCWGVAFDDFGQVFHKSGDRAEGYYSVPGMMRVSDPSEYHPRGALFRSPTKTTALDLIGSRHWPEAMQGSAVLGGFMAGEVEVHRLLDDGSGFRSEPQTKLVRSSSDAFRPVDVSVGPDGAIYMADWFNPIIGHYQASYRDPRRDQTRGRVWRLTSKGRAPVRRPRLERMGVQELVRQLESPERWVRFQAKRLLFWKPTTQVVAAADRRVAALSEAKGDSTASSGAAEDESAVNRQWVDIMGLYEAHETVRTNLLNRLAGSADPRVRAYGMRVVGGWAERLPDVLERLRTGVTDPHPRVRLEAVVACSRVRSPRAIEIALDGLDRPRDRFLDYALENVVRALRAEWQPALARGEIFSGENARHLSFALQVDASGEVLPSLRQLIESGKSEPASQRALLVALVNAGQPSDLQFAFERAGGSAEVYEELATVARVRGIQAPGDHQPVLAKLMRDGDPKVRSAAVNLAAAWGVVGMAESIANCAANDSEPEPVRVAALGATARLKHEGARDILERVARSQSVLPVRVAAVAAIGEIDLEQAARLTSDLMGIARDEAEMGQVLRPMLGRKGGAAALATALEKAAPGEDAAKLAARALAAAGRGDARLSSALWGAAGSTAESKPFSPEAIAEWVRESTAGDAAKGREVFRSSLANCVSCHRVQGEGGLQGPDLSAVAAALTPEQIVESVLWPKRQVKEGYLSTEVETKRGDYLQGYVVRESAEELVLRDAGSGRELRVGKAQISTRREAGTLMPDGMTSGLTRQEARDLFRYLMELGRASRAAR